MHLRTFWPRIVALLLLSGAIAGIQYPARAAPAALSLAQRTFYVAPDGNDANPGTADRPWQTIHKAATTLRAGETVYIKNGLYRGRVVPWYSGTAAQPIAYRAYPGHRPVLDGSTLGDDYKGLFQVVRKSHIEISGLTVRNSRVAGIFVRDSANITVRYNRIERSSSSGIGVWRSRNVVVERNVLVDCRIDPQGGNEMLSIADVEGFAVRHNEVYWTDPTCCGSTAGIAIKQGSRQGQVTGNQLHDLPGKGISLGAWDRNTRDLDVSRNEVTRVSTGISLSSELGGTVSEIRIYNNVVHNVKFAGIRFLEVAPGGLLEKVHIYHNTIVGSYGHGGAGILVATESVREIALTNNLINFGPDTTVGQIKAYKPSAITSRTNLVYGPKMQIQDPSLVEITDGTITADPQFVDRQHHNYRLRATSPARDRGTPIDLDRDYDGALRPIGAGYDIGAYEYRVIGPLNERVFLPAVVQR